MCFFFGNSNSKLSARGKERGEREEKSTHADNDKGEALGLEELDRALDWPADAKYGHRHVVVRLSGEAEADAAAPRVLDEFGSRPCQCYLWERGRRRLGEAHFIEEGLGGVAGEGEAGHHGRVCVEGWNRE
jgi:hypothetical protein